MKSNNSKTHFAPPSFPPLKHSSFILVALGALVCQTEDLLPHQLYLQNVLCGESLNNVSWSKFTLNPLSSSPGTLTWLPSSLHVLSLFFFFSIFFFWGGGLLDCWLTLALPSSNCKVSVTRKTAFQGTPPIFLLLYSPSIPSPRVLPELGGVVRVDTGVPFRAKHSIVP